MDHGLGSIQKYNYDKAAFDIYEVIAPRNVHLDDNSVVDAIGIVVIEAIAKGNVNRISIKNALHVSKLLLMNKFVSNGLKVQLNINKCIV